MFKPFDASRRKLIQGIGALGASYALTPAQAQSDFPKKPIKIILPLPAGGAADVAARAVALELEKSLKQSVIIDNRPGGLFQIAMQALLQAPADGHTIINLNSGMVSAQVVQKRYDLNKQLTPLTITGESTMVLMVGPSSPYKTLKDLVDHGRANPGKITYSTPGMGSVEHLKCAQLCKAAGVEAMNVTYKGGPDMVKAVIGGEVDFTIAPTIFALQYAAKGMVRVLAAVDNARLKGLADVPTVKEAGVDVSPLRIWGGYAVHSNTPPDVVARLFKEIKAAAVAPAVVERLMSFGMNVITSTSPDEFRQTIASDAQWMGDIAKGIHFEGK